MKTFKVIASSITYYKVEIEAENDVQALSKSFDGNFVEDIDWHESDSGISEYLERTVQRVIYEKV